MNKLKLDPRGYFLIRVSRPGIEVAQCSYTSGKIRKRMRSVSSSYLLSRIKQENMCSRKDHYEYMQKELKRAESSLKSRRKFVQD